MTPLPSGLILVVPPSEGKALGGSGPPWRPDDGYFGGDLGDERARIAAALAALDGGDGRMLGARGNTLDRARGANRNLIGAATLPAWQRYTGVVWDHLDPGSLPAEARRRIVVLSGLAGMVRSDDPIPDYRLKMGASVDGIGALARRWRPALTTALAARSARRFIVDLLAEEQRAALDLDALGERCNGVTVTLRHRDGTNGGHGAKAAKGRLARYLLTHPGDPVAALADWSDDTYVIELRGW